MDCLSAEDIGTLRLLYEACIPAGVLLSKADLLAEGDLHRAMRYLKQGDSELQKYFYIALGGSLGSIARYWVGTAIAGRLGTRFPYGTFVINVTACVIIGFSLELLGHHVEYNPAWRYLIPTGFIGAYSTFSTFEWETYANLRLGAFLIAGSYVGLSLLLGLIGVWCGVLLARLAP
jgi:CrcB protein